MALSSNPSNSSLVIEAIRAHNAGRDPERVAIKFAKMKASPFAFLRGACHLFYDTLPDLPVLNEAPLAWCCGDLHFENFGSYKADNRLAYFDITDFDEAALAPCTWDIVRLLTSIRCGADILQATKDEALSLGRTCLDAYRNTLSVGKPLWLERETASGPIHELLVGVQERNRADFLDRRSVRKGDRRRLKIDGIKTLAASDDERHMVTDFIAKFAAGQENPGFFDVHDIARRIAGTGSLGVSRFAILVEGKGSPDRNYLLDLKEARPSALLPRLDRLKIEQPEWADEAQRVVAVQKRMQAVDHEFLVDVDFNGVSSILKGLQPSEDRVAFDDCGRRPDRLHDVVGSMGRILAWDQLRASGRGGSACADELIAFAEDQHWMQSLLAATEATTQNTRQQWETFRSNSF